MNFEIIQKQNYWKVVIGFGIGIFLSNSILFILLGRVNLDEGWYLYASKLVYSGQYPYRDFAFTQAPLLPYIYGIPQIFFVQSLYLGRITSAFFSLISFILSIQIARNYGGEMAGGLTSLLGATFPFGIYFQSITKTYALTTFFFVLVLFALSSKLKHDVKSIVSTILVLLASLTRLSALFFAVPIIVYVFVGSKPKIKFAILFFCLVALFGLSVLGWQNIDAVKWGLVTHHTSQWGNASFVEKSEEILKSRIPKLYISFLQYIILSVAILFMGLNRVKGYLKNHPEIFITTIGLFLFLIPNLINGGFYTEYFVPFVFASFPILGISYVKTFHHQNSLLKAIMLLMVLFAMGFNFIRGGYNLIDISGGNTPIGELKEVSRIIRNNTKPDDKVFLLEALVLAIESHRQVMPNTTMAQFSLYETDTKSAKRLHLTNSQIILNDIQNQTPKVIVLTEFDRTLLNKTSNYQKIIMALDLNYSLLYSADNLGHHDSHIDIYIRRQDN